jgi:hypothetical protein
MADPELSEVANRLSGEIAEIPARAALAARQGFAIASALSETNRQKAVELILASLQKRGASFDTESVSTAINLPRRDAGRVMTALSITLGLLTNNVASPEEFVQAGRGTIFDAASEPTVRAVADLIISQRPTFEKAMARYQLSDVVLPSLAEFDVAVDLRVRFNNAQAEDFVAVAVVHIDTDGNNQEVWCQLSKADIDMILQKLGKAAREMELAEGLLAKVMPGNRQ